MRGPVQIGDGSLCRENLKIVRPPLSREAMD